jgi:hypothetical protein
MATQAAVRRIALSFPETEEADGHFAFSVRNKGKLKGFVWVWMERIIPKKPRVSGPGRPHEGPLEMSTLQVGLIRYSSTLKERT